MEMLINSRSMNWSTIFIEKKLVNNQPITKIMEIFFYKEKLINN